MERTITSMRELARTLKVRPDTISEIVRRRRIKTRRMPTNGKAKGLGPTAVAEITAVLSPPDRRRIAAG